MVIPCSSSGLAALVRGVDLGSIPGAGTQGAVMARMVRTPNDRPPAKQKTPGFPGVSQCAG